MPRLRRRTALIIVAILGVASVGAYLAVGYVGMQTALAEGGGCHVEQAGFTPAAFRTDGGVSSEFDASKLDPRPYLMPNFEEVYVRGEVGARRHDPRLVDSVWRPGRAGRRRRARRKLVPARPGDPRPGRECSIAKASVS